MIKIDFGKFIKDRMWFGWYWIGDTDSNMPFWSYSRYWLDRLWPVGRRGKIYPNWWFTIAGWQKL